MLDHRGDLHRAGRCARPLGATTTLAEGLDAPAVRATRRRPRRDRDRARRAARRRAASRASTAPPKPPPTMRAPAAPAALRRATAASTSGTRGVVVVAQARVRGVEQRADRLEVAGAQRRDHGVDAGVLGQHVARAPAAAARAALRPPPGRPARRCSTPSAAHAASALRAALVVAATRRGVRRRRSRASRAASREVERDGLERERGEVDPQRVALRRRSSEASWSSSPVSAPTQSFSTREQSRASSIRSGSSAPGDAEQREASAASSAAEEDSPEPLRDVARERRRAPARA